MCREKAVRLFTYLRELALLRTSLVRDLPDEDAVLWFCQIPQQRECYSIAQGTEREAGEDVWVEVARRKEPLCPRAPTSWTDWVDAVSLSDSSQEPTLRNKIPVHRSNHEDDPPVFVELKDAPEVQEHWLTYRGGYAGTRRAAGV